MYNKKKYQIAVIIPCYNEEKTIIDVIAKIPLKIDIIIINDGSTDNSKKKICEINRKLLLINNKKNIGYDKSLIKGFNYCLKKKYEFILTLDADDQFFERDILKIINQPKIYDLVSGVRTRKQRYGETISALLFKKETNIHDPYCGLKRYKIDKKFIVTFDKIKRQNLIGLQFLIPFLKNKEVKNIKIRIKKRFNKSKFGDSKKVSQIMIKNTKKLLNKKKIQLGIIGYNDGNGHPFSYAAIFNGFNKAKLSKKCPYPLIKSYLKNKKSDKGVIKNAEISYIWTEKINISKKIAEVSKIKNIVKNYQEFKNKVDGVILARDDHKLNFEIITFFLKNKIPIFVDKQFAKNFKEHKYIKKYVFKNKSLFHSGSCIRFSKEVIQTKKKIKKNLVIQINANSRSNWLRYAHHTLEPIIMIMGTNIIKIKAFNNKKSQFIQLFFSKNILANFSFNNKFFDIKSNFHIKNSKDEQVVFKNYYSCFRNTLSNFVEMIKQNKPMSNLNEVFKISEIVLKVQEKLNKKNV